MNSSGATGRVAFALIVKLPLAACVELVETRVQGSASDSRPNASSDAALIDAVAYQS